MNTPITLTDEERKGFGRSRLNSSTRREIKRKEAYLDRTCRKIWRAQNPKGELFTFSSFCRNRDRLIVTLETYVPRVGWVTCH